MRRRSPYKFLNSYEFEDRERFFGRDLEIDILLSDVVVNRLVVLFAKTGTGKTSLINAGVRPRLKERGYRTYVVRTRSDPFDSAYATLQKETRGRFPTSGAFPERLRELAKRVKRPVVIFFDQFEEFFLYTVSKDVARAERFVADVAELYEDPTSRVHLVFSMREEWFVEMGFFRDRIPAIFHADANLRLRWFDRDQAQAAIVGPAGPEAFAHELVDRLVDELVETGRAVAGTPSPGDIEPAQLQIVCDALWQERQGGALEVADYERLGDPARPESVARQLLDRRLVEEFDRFETREELELVTRMLPELATDEHTKRVREYGDLVSTLLSTPDPTLETALIRGVLERLKDARLVDIVPRESGELVELTHDYLVLRLDELIEAIGLIWPRRTLAGGLKAWRKNGTLLMSDVLPDLLARADDLPLDAATGELLLRSACGHLADLPPVMPALERSGAPVWDVIDERIRLGKDAERLRAIEGMTQVASPAAFDVLRRALDRGGEAAPQVLAALARAPYPATLDLLEHAANRPDLADDVRAALATLAESPASRDIVERAREILRRSVAGLPEEQRVAALVGLESVIAVELLVQMAGPRVNDALVSIAAAARPSAARSRARRAVFERVEAMLETRDVQPWVFGSLERIEDVTSARLLGRLAEIPPHRPPAERALDRLKHSTSDDVTAAATKELDRLAGEPPPEPPPPQPAYALPGEAPGGGVFASHYHAVLQLLANGRVVPFLGAGTALADREPHGAWETGRTLPSGAELANWLADLVRYPEPDTADLARVAQYVETAIGRVALQDALRDVFAHSFEPGPLHRLLASLPRRFRHVGRPSLPTIVSLCFDDRLERAFNEAGEPFDLLTYVAHGEHAGRFLYTPPFGRPFPIVEPRQFAELAPAERTAIVKLLGGVNVDEPEYDSFVLTEDDHVDYAIRAADARLLPRQLAQTLAGSAFLFLGYGLRDWSLRVLVRGLWSKRPERSYKSWAVQFRPSEVDVQLWRERNVEIIHAPLTEYVSELEHHVREFDVASVPA